MLGGSLFWMRNSCETFMKAERDFLALLRSRRHCCEAVVEGNTNFVNIRQIFVFGFLVRYPFGGGQRFRHSQSLGTNGLTRGARLQFGPSDRGAKIAQAILAAVR
jgi:hypothetical protein